MDVVTTFEDFYRLYRLFVRALLHKRLAHEQDRCDAESVVWFDVYRNFAEYQEGEPRLLLYRLVVWRANDIYRKRCRERDVEEAAAIEDMALSQWLGRSTAGGLQPDAIMAIREALSSESQRSRRLMFDRFVEELTWAELAARHQMHRNTAQKYITEAIKRLRARLDGLEW